MLVFLHPAQTSTRLVKLGQMSVVFLLWLVDRSRGSCLLGLLVVSYLSTVCLWLVYLSLSSNRMFQCWEMLSTLVIK